MGFINEKPSGLNAFAQIGTFVGMCLLCFAGVNVVLSNSPALRGAPTAGVVGDVDPRRLQFTQNLGPITTTVMGSIFDSSDSSSFGSSFEPSKSIESLSSGSLPSMDLRIIWDAMLSYTTAIWITVTATLCVQVLFGLCYYMKVVKPFGDETMLEEMNDEKGHGSTNRVSQRNDRASRSEGRGFDFDEPITGCMTNRWVCFHGLCCPMVRQAHTNQVAGICGFWETMCCWCCCTWVTLGLGPSCLVVFWRVNLKTLMGFSTDDVINDFCISCLCPQLSICQMATTVDRTMDSEVVGVCNIRNSGYFGNSGQEYH
jgi:hypothetical protein